MNNFEAEWLASFDRACNAQHGNHHPSPNMTQAHYTCLNHQLDVAAQRIEAVVRATDPELLIMLYQMSTEGEVSRCDDIAAQNERHPVPITLEEQAEWSAVRGILDQAVLRYEQEQLHEAYTSFQWAHRRAQALDYLPLVAETSLRLAEIELDRGAISVSEAEERMHDAARLAERGGADHLRGRAFLNLAFIMINYDFTRAQRWLDYAEGVLTTFDGASVTVELENARATLAQRQGRFTDSARHYRNALQSAVAANWPPTNTLALENALVNTLTLLDRWDDAGQHIEHAVEIAVRTYGETHLKTAEAWSALSSLHQQRGKLAKAIDVMRRVLSIHRRRLASHSIVLAETHSSLADLLMEAHEADEAAIHYQAALGIITSQLPPTASRSLLAKASLAHAYTEIGRRIEAQTLLRETVAAADHDSEDSLDDALVIGEHGHGQFLLGNFQAAYRDIMRSINNLEPLLVTNHSGLVGAYTQAGRAALATGELANARRALERAVAISGAVYGIPADIADAKHYLAEALHRAHVQPMRRRELARDAAQRYQTLIAHFAATSYQRLTDDLRQRWTSADKLSR